MRQTRASYRLLGRLELRNNCCPWRILMAKPPLIYTTRDGNHQQEIYVNIGWSDQVQIIGSVVELERLCLCLEQSAC